VSAIRVVDHTAVAKVFLLVRRATNSTPAAMRVALAAYRVMAPGPHCVGLSEMADRLARSFELAERRIREDGVEPSQLARTEKALREVLETPRAVRVPRSEGLIRRAVAEACVREGVTETQLRGPRGTNALAAIRHGVWYLLTTEGVGPVDIARHFKRDHSSVSQSVAKYAARLMDGGARRPAVAAPEPAADVAGDAREAA
jgi:hypothetical protein